MKKCHKSKIIIIKGTACGKYHRVSTLAVIEEGDSDILKTTE